MAKKKEISDENTKMSIDEIRKSINKKAGENLAYDLKDDSPTKITDWIPTGSRWLDSIICRGKLGGIPCGKVSELAGLEGSGKSYMAAQIAANAQKMDIDVIYFDSESAIDPDFWQSIGCDLEKMVYVQAKNVEFVLETIEELLKTNSNRMLFIWDSFALTPSLADLEGTFNPNESMAVKPRIMSKGLSKLIQPLANTQSTLLVLNQLKTNLSFTGNIKYITDSERYTTPGGKGLAFAYSLRMWLTSRRGKDSYVNDQNGYRIGNEVKVRLEKSRFGTVGRECSFRILWAGENIGIMDDESVFEAIKPFLKQSGAWYEVDLDGKPKKFQASQWQELMDDDVFRNVIYDIMEKEVIVKFENREGNAKDHYDLDGLQSSEALEE